MARPANFFRTLNGIPVHYDRTPVAPYGSRGIPAKFHATNEFENKLDACFAELEQTCPLGRPEVITSAGAWVDKPGFHGRGKAFDLDGIHWANKIFICLHFPTDRHFYIGVEAVLRKFSLLFLTSTTTGTTKIISTLIWVDSWHLTEFEAKCCFCSLHSRTSWKYRSVLTAFGVHKLLVLQRKPWLN